MKQFLKTRWISLLIILFCLIVPAVIFVVRGWTFQFDPQCQFKIYRMKPYWKSYSIYWCYGFDPDTGKHYYHLPKFHHADLEAILKAQEPVIQKQVDELVQKW